MQCDMKSQYNKCLDMLDTQCSVLQMQGIQVMLAFDKINWNQYIQTFPDCPHILKSYNSNGSNFDVNFITLCWEALTEIYLRSNDPVPISVLENIVNKKQLIYASLLKSNAIKLNQSCLTFFSSVAVHNSEHCSLLLANINLSHRIFHHMTKGNSPLRCTFIKFMLSFLFSGELQILISIFKFRILWLNIFKWLSNDPVDMIYLVLSTLAKCIFTANINKKIKCSIFTPTCLAYFVKLFEKHDCIEFAEYDKVSDYKYLYEPTVTLPQQLNEYAYAFTCILCTSDEAGIWFQPKINTIKEGKFNNPSALYFAKMLCQDVAHSKFVYKLLLNILLACTDIVKPIFLLEVFNLSVKNNPNWIFSISLLIQYYSELGLSTIISKLKLHESNLDSTQLYKIISSILYPPRANKASLSQGIQSADITRKIFNLYLLYSIFGNAIALIDIDSNVKGSPYRLICRATRQCLCNRIPEISVLISLLQQLLQSTSNLVKDNHDLLLEDFPDEDIIIEIVECIKDRNKQIILILKILRQYQQLFPYALLQTKFNPTSLFNTNTPFDEITVDSDVIHEILNLMNSLSTGYFKLTDSNRTEKLICYFIYIYCTSESKKLRDNINYTVTRLLTELLAYFRYVKFISRCVLLLRSTNQLFLYNTFETSNTNISTLINWTIHNIIDIARRDHFEISENNIEDLIQVLNQSERVNKTYNPVTSVYALWSRLVYSPFREHKYLQLQKTFYLTCLSIESLFLGSNVLVSVSDHFESFLNLRDHFGPFTLPCKIHFYRLIDFMACFVLNPSKYTTTIIEMSSDIMLISKKAILKEQDCFMKLMLCSSANQLKNTFSKFSTDQNEAIIKILLDSIPLNATEFYLNNLNLDHPIVKLMDTTTFPIQMISYMNFYNEVVFPFGTNQKIVQQMERISLKFNSMILNERLNFIKYFKILNMLLLSNSDLRAYNGIIESLNSCLVSVRECLVLHSDFSTDEYFEFLQSLVEIINDSQECINCSYKLQETINVNLYLLSIQLSIIEIIKMPQHYLVAMDKFINLVAGLLKTEFSIQISDKLLNCRPFMESIIDSFSYLLNKDDIYEAKESYFLLFTTTLHFCANENFKSFDFCSKEKLFTLQSIIIDNLILSKKEISLHYLNNVLSRILNYSYYYYGQELIYQLIEKLSKLQNNSNFCENCMIKLKSSQFYSSCLERIFIQLLTHILVLITSDICKSNNTQIQVNYYMPCMALLLQVSSKTCALFRDFLCNHRNCLLYLLKYEKSSFWSCFNIYMTKNTNKLVCKDSTYSSIIHIIFNSLFEEFCANNLDLESTKLIIALIHEGMALNKHHIDSIKYTSNQTMTSCNITLQSPIIGSIIAEQYDSGVEFLNSYFISNFSIISNVNVYSLSELDIVYSAFLNVLEMPDLMAKNLDLINTNIMKQFSLIITIIIDSSFCIEKAQRIIYRLIYYLYKPQNISADYINTPNQILNKIIFHPDFDKPLIQKSEGNRQLLHLILQNVYELIVINDFANDASFLPDIIEKLLLFYQATLTYPDNFILKIFYQLEINNHSIADSFLTVFCTKDSGGKNPSTSHHSISPAQIMDKLDGQLFNELVSDFPTNRKLNPNSVIESENLNSYDPAYIIPLLGYILRPEYIIDCSKMIHKGYLSIFIKSLSSNDKDMRIAAMYCLELFSNHFHYNRFKEKKQIMMILELIQNLITSKIERLPSVYTALLVRSLPILLHPEDALFIVLCKYFLSNPEINLENIPLVNMFLFSSSTQHYAREKRWILRILVEGMLCEDDYDIYRKRHVIQLMLCCVENLNDDKIYSLICKFFLKINSFPSAKNTLISFNGMKSWLVLTYRNTQNKDLEQAYFALFKNTINRP